MKQKLFLLAITALLTANVWAQTPWQTGSDGKIYYNGGNVGVGTASPNEKLEINGTALVNQIKFNQHIMIFRQLQEHKLII